MFNVSKATGLPSAAHAWVTSPFGDGYFAVQDKAKNGNIDPAYLMLAYAFDQGWDKTAVHSSYKLDQSWMTAASGLISLASSALGSFQTSIWQQTSAAKAGGLRGNLHEVSLAGAPPPDSPGPLDAGDIFAPNSRGYHNIPRLYLMAALVLEEKANASVVALVANERGLIVAMGKKSHGEHGCGHAEVRALLSIKGLVPGRAMLFSTLKPCNMCAGLIRAVFSGNCKQYWARSDPSAGANYQKVTGLSLPNGLASTESAKNDVNRLRQIKLQDGSSFNEVFSQGWDSRDGRLALARTGAPERMKQAYLDWCDAVIKPGAVVGRSPGVEVRVKKIEAVLAKAKACGDANALSKRNDIFEHWVKNSSKASGMVNDDQKLILAAFTNSAQAKGVDSPIKIATKEAGMGIVEYISAAPRSTNLRTSARNALSSKFMKYGKSAGDVQGVTGARLTAPAGPPPPSRSNDVRMATISNYLFGFLQTQR
ncbi:Bd3614 family nucleic acid deaminase [Variovorax sp. KK3]|uniref:Bd3614 family nucleic acid deaminase n=1 Tax=Variovorax sp. KK3 TaxID=1855728 RepID=UPI00097C402A|nr:Bd3614 family nucleic acid deaminase [Variovorax sp. KK3]